MAKAALSRNTPHHRRREQVYQLLHEASNQLENPTYDELIEYVRVRTGKGCSRKLISQWKKDGMELDEVKNQVIPFPTRQLIPPSPPPEESPVLVIEPVSTEPPQPRKLPKPSWLKRFTYSTLVTLGLASSLWVASTVNEKTAIADEPQPVVTPKISSKKESPRTQPRRLPITVILNSPEDLRIKQGDEIVKGQIISDRTIEKQQLLERKEQLTSQIERASLPLIAPLEPDFTTRQRMLEQTKSRLKLTEKQLDPGFQFKTRELQEVFEPEKIAQVNQAQQQQLSQKIEIESALSQLEQSKAQYQRDLNQYQQAEERQRLELTSLTDQLTQVEQQLKTLTSVRSPYNGTVRKIKVKGQVNQQLETEITLDVIE